ncbi:MAG TPA: biopolymer transporter ExbD [Acetobacteraceae bacterium]|nr:biopolymer transporter ExbD [Acetobacteraceae bacterium]
MQVLSNEKPYDDINITPMLDLAYVLLVIFIIMTTAAVQGIKVDLPKASAAVSLVVPKTKVIAVTAQGQILLDAVPVTISELEARLRDLKAITPDLPVIVKGDRAVQYEKIMQVIDVCSRVGVQSIGLAAQKFVGS